MKVAPQPSLLISLGLPCLQPTVISSINVWLISTPTLQTSQTAFPLECLFTKLMRLLFRRLRDYRPRTAPYRQLLEGLRKVGFKLNMGPENTGLFGLFATRRGGYYVGASYISPRTLAARSHHCVQIKEQARSSPTDASSSSMVVQLRASHHMAWRSTMAVSWRRTSSS
jgi:hypothetical protein